jgi:gliding motility-associated-like protein
MANAGSDMTLCFNTGSQINASIVGNRFVWTPTTGLDNPASLTPFARPRNTTRYILSAFDTLGCPKPGRDTVLVTILPEVVAFAGRDTSVVVNQPLQFNATGGRTYSWSPGTSLTNPGISDPVAVYNGTFDNITYFLTVTDENNCTDVDTINVRIFRTAPQIFVPSAFTPNGDGRNDFFRPVAVGITKIDYFRVYNRWGQMVFETRVNEMGWDGKINGVPQGTNTYVWVVKGEDYTGKVVTAKGTVTLVR